VLMHDFSARVAALGLVGCAAARRVVAVDYAVWDDVVFFLFNFDETHGGRCQLFTSAGLR
jgi:hypothetical protein